MSEQSNDLAAENPMNALLRQSWGAAMFVGVLSIALGAAVMVWPGKTILVVAVLIGLQMVFSGIFRLIEALSGATDSPWLIAIGGIILLGIGVWALRNPSNTAAVLGLVIGIVWFVTGVVQFLAALFSNYFPHRFWMMIGGAISVAAGVVLLATPDISIQTLAWVTGLYMVIWGVIIIFSGLIARP